MVLTARANRTRPHFSVNTDRISPDKASEVSKWVDRYLGMGEWVMDQSTAVAGASGWFNRTR
ncbi:hypothetical protein SLS62_004974 [Diatrype stigma]|uniref:Uncharacterized protein n=1 Tax=Diatrype stigma TaxID=117547 RepID=A0AAN9UVL7_9PEZI